MALIKPYGWVGVADVAAGLLVYIALHSDYTQQSHTLTRFPEVYLLLGDPVKRFQSQY